MESKGVQKSTKVRRSDEAQQHLWQQKPALFGKHYTSTLHDTTTDDSSHEAASE
jgi:hypothetical protein